MATTELETERKPTRSVVKYVPPPRWIQYDALAILDALAHAKAAVMALKTMPYQRSWAEVLQKIQLKREVAGTSRIEGADFTDNELDAALNETPEQLLTRSQRQAHAAVRAYRWIGELPEDYPVDGELICRIHRLMVEGADDDHCPPGKIRGRDENVTFGAPLHRGAEGGEECAASFEGLSAALETEFRGHDLLVQALAVHYHFAAMHPFLDGNGRTARALEALMLQRAGLRDSLFIAMSNYYYDEKREYLECLSRVREQGYDLTPFLIFGLKGIALQCQRLTSEIRRNVQKALFRNMMFDLFQRLESTRKRVIAKRQLELLKMLLNAEEIEYGALIRSTERVYKGVSNPQKALVRDLNYLLQLGAINVRSQGPKHVFFVRLEWATEITETTFFERVNRLPKSKMYNFL